MRAGHSASVAAAYREQIGYVWATLRRLGVPQSAVEDAAHDVFVVVHRRAADFEGHREMRAWLFGISRRIAHRYRRTAERTRRRRAALATLDVRAIDLDDVIARKEGWLVLQSFLDSLDEGKRAAFVLGEIESFDRKRLGAALGISPNTAYSRLRAARALFQERFAPSSDEARAALVVEGRGEPSPPAAVQRRVWSAIAGTIAGPHGAGATVALASSAKIFAAALAVGTVALVGLDATLPNPSEGTKSPAPAPIAVPRERSDPIVAAVSATPRTEPVTTTTSIDVGATGPPPAAAPQAKPTPKPDGANAPSSLADEAALVRRAREELEAGHPALALVQLGEHRKRFANGKLASEREASRIRALCSLGRRAEALRLGKEFVGTHPSSAYLQPLQGSCVAELIKSEPSGEPDR